MLFRLLRWTGITVLGLLLLLVLFGFERYVSLRGSLPDYEGTLTVAGLSAPVRITRDRRAVPHIDAASLADASYALGLTHAQDRLWQMMFLRRVGQGRLSELFGRFALDADRTIRALDLEGLARSGFDALSPESRAALTAYARGVNARIVDRDRPLPPEFFLLQTDPQEWRPHDPLILMSMLGLGLSGNAFSELRRLELAQHLDPVLIGELLAPAPGLPEGVDLADFLRPEDETGKMARADLLFPPLGASNNWVVDGSRSATGVPLLANDPHLGLLMPGLWYLARLEIGGRRVVGATLPGIPAVLMGQTDDVAWGITNTGTDVQDLVLERLDPADPGRYLTPDGARSFETREATIGVRFGGTVTETLKTTRHGPVLPLLQERAPGGHVWSLLWTGLTPENRTLEVSMRILNVGSVAEARQLMADYVVPTQNFVFADRSGEIGFLAAGAVPVRGEDVPGRGLVPVAGWKHREIWTGRLDLDALPQIWRPAEGRLVTANNDIRPPGYDRFITAEWTHPWRAERITTLLDAQPSHDLDSFAAIMADDLSGLRRPLLARMIALTPEDPETATYLALLRAWDGSMATDRAEPLIMVAWLGAVTETLATDELGDLADGFGGIRPRFMVRVFEDRDSMAHWCDRVDTPDAESCGDLLDQALRTAIARLEDRFGRDRSTWRWGPAHRANHRHLPFGFVPVLSNFFSRGVDTPGGTYTVDRASYSGGGGTPFANVHGAAYRALYDLANPDRSRFMVATGQSGNPYSPHYDDHVAPWGAGRFFTIGDRPEAPIGTLTLEPASPAP